MGKHCYLKIYPICYWKALDPQRLCIHSRWGVGSMDFIHDLLISEDDLDDDDNADCFANQ